MDVRKDLELCGGAREPTERAKTLGRALFE